MKVKQKVKPTFTLRATSPQDFKEKFEKLKHTWKNKDEVSEESQEIFKDLQ